MSVIKERGNFIRVTCALTIRYYIVKENKYVIKILITAEDVTVVYTAVKSSCGQVGEPHTSVLTLANDPSNVPSVTRSLL